MRTHARFDRSRRFGILALAFALTPSAFADVSGLGRIEPDNGIMRITAPVTPEATTGVVLAALRVGPGDIVEAGQVLAITESSGVLEALLAEARATVVSADLEARAEEGRADAACVLAQTSRREADRRASLLERQLSSQEEWERADADARFQEASCRAARIGTEAARGRVRLAEAMVVTREAALERSRVRAPFAGRVLEVMTWPGELVGRDGILELAAVDRMYAIAEIYETDVAQVRAGQRATVRSKALAQPLGGVVEHVRLQVRKQDEFGTDPAARQDARIVEVEIRLDDPAPAAGLTNLQVEVVIES